MKTLLCIFSLTSISFLFGQSTRDSIQPSAKQIVRGIDISKAPSGEQQMITYFETLSDEELLEFVKKHLLVGEIVYKKY